MGTFRPLRFPIAIIGAGALGLHFAARLAAQGPVAVIARNPERAAVLRVGVAIGAQRYVPDVFAPEDAPDADWVLVLVKAADTADAARTAQAMAPRGVLSLQNGLIGDMLAAGCGAIPVDQGITTEGAFRDGACVVPSGAGETLVPPGFEAVAAALAAAGFRTRVEPDIAAARLAKLLVNVAINPLAALFRVPNGALLEVPHRGLLDALVEEAWPVLRAAGLQVDADAARARVHAVALATAGNRASMLQDVLAGRRTEIDAITGTLLDMAAAQGAELPTHRAVFTLVKRLEGCPSVSS
ncbi:ketopantoate reductase family protein [Zoogloea sp.]|uniref:ketopantoate reductase family protein n=1 Tax=Zoogloea sp. TaxID=49181 RepID=UPI0035B18886